MNLCNVSNRQYGFSSICVLITLLFLTSAGFLGLRLGSPYVEYRILAGAIDDAVKHEDIETVNSRRLIFRIKESVRRNSGVSPSKLNLDKILYVASRDGHRLVGVNYEVAVKLFYNVSALLHFKHEAAANPYG